MSSAPYSRDQRGPYNDFNPRAYTQSLHASYTSLNSPKPKQEGPLINFNRHPDSYMVVGYGQTANPMPPSTKKKVVATRWVQFALRVFQLIGALGLLVCVICIKGMQNTEGWIIRIPPGWDAAVCTYGVYHLLRPAKGRTPASSASYHFFALFMDGGMIPLYVFTSLMARTNWSEAPGTTGRWRSFFPTDADNATIFFTTWLASAVVGGLHLISAFLDIYLLIMFRRIARLPPDMSPLDDNLTSRGASKHKHKNSEMTASTMSVHEKKLSNMSGSTLNLYNPSSLSIPDPNARIVPFAHSRKDSDATFSPHTLDSARHSRTNVNSQGSLYQQPISNRTSRADVRPNSLYDGSRPASRTRSRSRPDSFLNSTHDPMPERITSPFSYVSSQTDVNSRHSTPQPGPQNAVTNTMARQQQSQSLLSDNWQVLDEPSDLGEQSRRPHDEQQYRYAQQERHEILPSPLGMHPPTATQSPQRYYARPQEVEKQPEEDIGRALTMGSSVYSDTASIKSASTVTPKTKYYGDLAAATMGIRGSGQGSPERTDFAQRPAQHVGGRNVSRTGADIADVNVMYMDENRGKGNRGRNVSGKMAEEGRTSWGMRKREVSGVA